MIGLLAFFVLLYSVLMLVLLVGWRRLPKLVLPAAYQPRTRISVLVAVRNEAENMVALLRDLEKQRYPADLFEVLIIDDFSEDETAALVTEFARNSSLNLRLLSLENGRGKGKKSAIAYGLQHATGALMVQTDGDCRVPPTWLALFEYAYVSRHARFISGPVGLKAGNSFFQKMQVAEFASLIGSGAASISIGKPNMCNGANLAYEKAAFAAVAGFAGNEQIASGDDEFLMHKIHALFPGSIFFLKNPAATVFTPAATQLKTFLAQRVRWASKWRFYQNIPAQLLAVLIFSVNLILLLAAFAAAAGTLPASVFLTAFLLKSGFEILFLGNILSFLNSARFMLYCVPVQLVYMPYVLYCALAGLTGKYRWKGRNLKNA